MKEAEERENPKTIRYVWYIINVAKECYLAIHYVQNHLKMYQYGRLLMLCQVNILRD